MKKKDQILSLTGSVKEIAQRLNAHPRYVRKIRAEYGIKSTRIMKYKQILNHKGTDSEAAKELGTSIDYVKKVRIANGLRTPKETKAPVFAEDGFFRHDPYYNF